MEYAIFIGIVVLIILVVILLLKKSNYVGDDSKVTDILHKNEVDSVKRSSEQTNTLTSNINNGLEKIYEKLVKMSENLQETVKKSFEPTNNTIDEFKAKFAVLEENNKKIEAMGEQLIGIEKIFKANKEVGNFGEQLLEQVLSAYFGEDNKLYQLQYFIKNGCIVDSAIFMPKEIVCIDAKFPLGHFKEYLDDNYLDKELALKNLTSACKTQIKAIADKYIIPGVTANYACMFVPSDNLISLLHKKCYEVFEYSYKNKVILLSPSTIISFVSSLKSVKLDYEKNEKCDELYKQLNDLASLFKNFKDRWSAVYSKIGQLYEERELLDITARKLTNRFNMISDAKVEEEEK